MNFILKENESFIHIFYSIDGIYNNTFVAIELPHKGKLTEDNNDWISLPRDSDTTLIYKQFLCQKDYNNCSYHSFENYYEQTGNDQHNLEFKISEPIDAKQFYTHSLNIPVGGSVQSDVMEFIQFDIDDKGVYSWDSDWRNMNFQLTVSVPDEATEINLIPDAHPHEQNFESQNLKRMVYAWNVPDFQTAFHVDYIMPSERAHYQSYNTLGIILIGGGISIIGVFIDEMINKRKSDAYTLKSIKEEKDVEYT